VERFRWVLLCIGALILGGFAYVLIGQDRMVDLGVIIWMGLMAFWFIASDWKVDSYRP
jgi:hypothetical protein